MLSVFLSSSQTSLIRFYILPSLDWSKITKRFPKNHFVAGLTQAARQRAVWFRNIIFVFMFLYFCSHVFLRSVSTGASCSLLWWVSRVEPRQAESCLILKHVFIICISVFVYLYFCIHVFLRGVLAAAFYGGCLGLKAEGCLLGGASLDCCCLEVSVWIWDTPLYFKHLTPEYKTS